MIEASKTATETEASTLTHPNERGAIIAPVRPTSALLWACKYCGAFTITKHRSDTIEDNWRNGSSREPLRAVCPKCKKRNRLRSENHDLVWAEVPWRRITQRKALKRVAENLNIIKGDAKELPRRKVAHDEWNREVGYKGKKHTPQPFKRWQKRGDA